jgi:dTDP-4-amino-4,6-dideoxygalactose transaminase
LTATATARDVHTALRQAIARRFAVPHVHLTATGRAGLTLLLRAMRRLRPGHDEVIVPAYTCFSVAASVVKAGLRPRPVDISSETLGYLPEELAATNLYGLPNDLPALCEWARSRGVFVIDDAAQAMGAAVAGRWCGTWGDAGLFSFDKGKNVTAIDGGAIVTHSDDVAAAMDAEMAGLPSAAALDSWIGAAKAVAYFAFLRPWLYGLPNRVPQLGLGKSLLTTEFPLEAPSRALVVLASTMMDRLDDFNRVRTGNARALSEGLRTVRGVVDISLVPHTAPVYLRLPVLIPDGAIRRRAADALTAAGLGVSESYPAALPDVDGLQRYLAGPSNASGARWVARSILTLPTHPFVTVRDVARIVDVISRATAGVAGAVAA